MIPVIPSYVTAAVVTGVVVLALAVRQLFAHAASRSGLARQAQASVAFGVGAYLLLWLGLALYFAPSLASSAGQDPYAVAPMIPIFAIAGPLGFVLALRRSSSLRRVMAELSVPGLIAVQTFRAMGVLFLVLMTLGQMPAHFALPAGWGDVGIGLAAPVVAFLLARGTRWPAVIWNLLGLTDLIVAVGMGTGFATPFLVPGVASRLPAVAAMGGFPMILVPAFAVPIAFTLHVLALRAMLGARGRAPVEAMAG